MPFAAIIPGRKGLAVRVSGKIGVTGWLLSRLGRSEDLGAGTGDVRGCRCYWVWDRVCFER